MSSIGVDTTGVDTRDEFAPLPKGDYLVTVSEASVGPTKNGAGTRLRLKLDVLEGQFKGRKIFDGLNTVNTNADAQRIGQRILAQLQDAVGAPRKDCQTYHLLNKPVYVWLGIDKEGKNQINGFGKEPRGGATTTTTGPAAAPPASQAAPAIAAGQPAPNSPPWARRNQ